MSTVVEREDTPDITRHICFAYQLTGFYMIKGFTERYFLQLYLRKALLFRKCARLLFQTFFIQNLLCKQLRKSIVTSIRISFDPYISHIIAMHVHYLQKERNGFVAKFFSKYFFGPKVIPNYISSEVPRSRNQVKLSIKKTKVVGRF